MTSAGEGRRLRLLEAASVEEPLEGTPDAGQLVTVGRHNLPYRTSSFVGRQDDVAAVAALLAESRLVTLTGPGGMGKTRLAVEVARRGAPNHAGGVWLAELSALADPSALAPTVAAAIAMGEHDDRLESATEVAGFLGNQSVLLVLDNCEHLAAACASFVEVVLRLCPNLRVLATSREALGLPGEQRWAVGPLTLPAVPDAGAVAASEAGALFLQRAVASFPAFQLTETTAPPVAEICRRLDGLPLAIELAAARVASLAPADILDRLGDGFRLLQGSPALDPRHRTLAAALEWSHELLTPSEAALLRRLSVFAGWTLAAAEEVGADPELAPDDLVEHLSALVTKSLVVVDANDAGTRYRQLGTIRSWAAGKLEASGEAEALRRRHANWCLRLVERANRLLDQPRPGAVLIDLDAEHDNVRAALEWARAEGEAEIGLRLATNMVTFWRLRGHLREGVRWLEWAAEAGAGGPERRDLRAAALRGAGLLRALTGDVAGAIPLLEESSAAFAHQGDECATVCVCNPMFLMFRNPRAALPELEERIAFCRTTTETDRLAHLLFTAGQAWFFIGDAAEARRRFEETVELGRALPAGEALRCGLLGLARVAQLEGDYTAAETRASEVRALAEDDLDLDDTATALGMLGDLARARGHWRRAGKLLDQSVDLARQEGSPLLVGRCLLFRARLLQWEDGAHDAEADSLFQESLALARAGGGLSYQEIRCLLGLGDLALGRNSIEVAAQRFLEALEKAQAMGDRQGSAQALDSLAEVAAVQGDTEQARTLVLRALELRHTIGDLPGTASSLEAMAAVTAEGRRLERAARMVGAAQALRDAKGYSRSARETRRHQKVRQDLTAQMGPDAFAAAWAEGTALTPEEAVAYALRGHGSRDRPSHGWSSLTPAERDVLRLVREGLPNAEVAQRLFVSPRTVTTHLTRVYGKLGLRSRSTLIKELAGRQL